MLTPLSILFTYAKICGEYRNSKFLNDSKYIMHLIVLLKTVNMIIRAYSVENEVNEHIEKVKVFLFDLSVCFSSWYIYLFRKLVDDSTKRHTKTHIIAFITSFGAAGLHASLDSEDA